MSQRIANFFTAFGRFFAVFGLTVIHVIVGACLCGGMYAGLWGAMLLALFAVPGAAGMGLLAAAFAITPCRHRSLGEWISGGVLVGAVAGTWTALALAGPRKGVLAFAVFGMLTGMTAGAHARRLLATLSAD